MDTKKKMDSDAMKIAVLTMLMRFGPLPAHVLFALVVDASGYPDESARKTWERHVRAWEAERVLVRMDAAPDQKRDVGVPDKTKLSKLAKAGAELLTAAGITDAIGTSPSGLRGSDFHVPGSWKHDAVGAGFLARIQRAGFQFITDLEIQRVCKSLGEKLPDALIRKGDEGPWTAVEVEFAKKTGGWADRQARMMAQAMEFGFVLGGKWQVEGAWLVTTSRPESPTPQEMGERIAAYLTQPAVLTALVFEVDEAGKLLGGRKCEVELVPAPEDQVVIKFERYGEDYFGVLCAEGTLHDKAVARGEDRPPLPKRVTVASWKLGDFHGEISIDYPMGGWGIHHYASLYFKGELVSEHHMLGHVDVLPENLSVMLLELTRWGHDDMDQTHEGFIAELVENKRTHLIKHLPELARWLRSDGRTLQEIVLAVEKQ